MRRFSVAVVAGVFVGAFGLLAAAEAVAEVADSAFDLTAADDSATLRPHSPGRLELVGPTFADFDFPIPTTSLTVTGGPGIDMLTIDGSIDLGAASLLADFEQIMMPPSSHIQTTGDVVLTASAASAGASLPPQPLPPYVAEFDLGVELIGVDAIAAVSLDGATIVANSLDVTASVAANVSSSSNNFVHAMVNTTADVTIHNSTLTTQSDLSMSSALVVALDVKGQGDANELNGADGAIASVDMTSLSSAAVTGSTTIAAGGNLSIHSMSDVDAIGSGEAQFGNLGGGVSIVRVSDTTKAFVDTTNVVWNATSMSVQALANDVVSSSSSSSPDGSDPSDFGANYPSPGSRTDGATTVVTAGALSFVNHASVVEAYVQGGVSISTTDDLSVDALSLHDDHAVANGSTADLGGTGYGNAIAVNRADVRANAWLAEGISIDAPGGLTVSAKKIAGVADAFDATATSGLTSAPLPGLASLELNDITNERVATIGPPASVTTGELSLVDDSNTTKLMLEGTVVNDNDGLAVVGDWMFSASGSDGVPGVFDLTQSGPAGYELTSLTCDNGPGQVASVSLSLGDIVTCTFVNDDIAPPDGLMILDDPCVVYDSDDAGDVPFIGGETRTVQVTGALAGQGGAATCVPLGASSVVFRVSSIDPLTEGNLRMTPAGLVATGGAGVVNYGANGLDNTNTVTIPVSTGGAVDIQANAGVIPGTEVPITDPTTDVRVVVIGFYAPDVDAGLMFFPVNPCAVADSRTNKGADGTFDGPADNGLWPVGSAFPDVDLVGDFPAGQGGGNGVGNPNGNPTSCGVPADADAVLVNVVAVNAAGGSGFLSVGVGGVDPIEEATTPFAVLSPKMNNGATTVVKLDDGDTIAIDVDGAAGASTMVRVEVLGYYDDDVAGLDFTAVAPCAAFDSRPNKGALLDFAGERPHGPVDTTIYQVAGDDLPVGQGGVVDSGDGTGTCGVPQDAAAVLINLEAVNALVEGNFWVSAAGTTTTGGVLNFNKVTPKMNNANAVVVPLSASGLLALEVNAGSFTSPGTPVAHARGVVLGYYN